MKQLFVMFSLISLLGLMGQASVAYAVDPQEVGSAASNLARKSMSLSTLAEAKSCGMTNCQCQHHQLMRAAEMLELAASELADFALGGCEHCLMVGETCDKMKKQFRQAFGEIQKANYRLATTYYSNFWKYDYSIRRQYRQVRVSFYRVSRSLRGLWRWM